MGLWYIGFNSTNAKARLMLYLASSQLPPSLIVW